jgi:hypothetical protein
VLERGRADRVERVVAHEAVDVRGAAGTLAVLVVDDRLQVRALAGATAAAPGIVLVALAEQHESPRDTNYYGRKEVGDFLKSILTPGGSVDWRTLMQETMGEGLSARPMVEYFAPLHEWLKQENRGRQHTLAPI